MAVLVQMIYLRCPKDYVWLVVFARDPAGIYRTYLADQAPFAGIIAPVPTNMVTHEWLIAQAQQLLPAAAARQHLELSSQFTKGVSFHHHEITGLIQVAQFAANSPSSVVEVQAYMATYSDNIELNHYWHPLPDLIRRHQIVQVQKIYTLMWQVLMHGYQQPNCKVIVK